MLFNTCHILKFNFRNTSRNVLRYSKLHMFWNNIFLNYYSIWNYFYLHSINKYDYLNFFTKGHLITMQTSAYCGLKSFVRHMICKYFLLIVGLSFYLLRVAFRNQNLLLLLLFWWNQFILYFKKNVLCACLGSM